MSPVWFFALAVVILASGIGITLNTSIVIFSVNNVKKGFTMNRCDQVHLMMGLVNILIQCVMATQTILWIGVFQIFVKQVFTPICFLILNYCSYWLTSWLCVVYCITIANFTHQLFVWLKRRLSSHLPHLLLLSIGGSLTVSVPSLWALVLDPEEGTLENLTQGLFNNNGTLHLNLMYVVTATVFGCCMPFVLTLISVILTISSLLQHIHNMKQNDMDLGQSKLRAHTGAVRTMMIHLILVLSFYIAEMLSFSSESVTVNAKSSVGFLCMLSYPIAQSAIIFQSNSQLRRVFVEMFRLKNLCDRPNQNHSTERVKNMPQGNNPMHR